MNTHPLEPGAATAAHVGARQRRAAAHSDGSLQGMGRRGETAAGLVVATLGMAFSELVEKKRMDASNSSGGVTVSAFWLVP